MKNENTEKQKRSFQKKTGTEQNNDHSQLIQTTSYFELSHIVHKPMPLFGSPLDTRHNMYF